MSFKKSQKCSFKTKLATILLLSLSLNCFPYATASTITISTPIKQNLSDTIIPHNLRSFSESDYFSSEIDDTVVKTSSPFVFENIPSWKIDTELLELLRVVAGSLRSPYLWM